MAAQGQEMFVRHIAERLRTCRHYREHEGLCRSYLFWPHVQRVLQGRKTFKRLHLAFEQFFRNGDLCPFVFAVPDIDSEVIVEIEHHIAHSLNF